MPGSNLIQHDGKDTSLGEDGLTQLRALATECAGGTFFDEQ